MINNSDISNTMSLNRYVEKPASLYAEAPTVLSPSRQKNQVCVARQNERI